MNGYSNKNNISAPYVPLGNWDGGSSFNCIKDMKSKIMKVFD